MSNPLHRAGCASATRSHEHAHRVAQLHGLGLGQMFLEMKIGSLEVGNKAVMTNRDRHLYSPAMDDITNMNCLITPS